MSDFLDLIREVHQERQQREREFIAKAAKKKGPGRGWWGPPKGTHGKGKSEISREVKEAVSAGIGDVQAHGLETGNEAAIAIDAEGKKIDGMPKGGETSCNIKKILTGKEHVIIHNHPNSVSFSNQDVAQIWDTNAKHLVVIGHDGTLYRLSRTAKTREPSPEDEGQFVSLAVLSWGNYVGKHQSKFMRPVGLGQMSKEQAWKEQTHLGMIDFAEYYNLDYERILP